MDTQSKPINLSFTDRNGKETHLQNTANCYIIRNEGTYQIPLVYGNAIRNGQVNTKSFYTAGIATDFQDSYGVPFNAWSSPFIKDHTSAQGKKIASAEVLWNDGTSKITNLYIDDDFLTFDVKSFSPCNALIAVKDNNGTVLWSWHLWLTDTDLTPKIITNKKGVDFKVMPCNLGWNGWTTDGKPTSPYYQWGRKDPFIANEKTSEKNSTIFKYIDTEQQQYVSHQNPKTFFKCDLISYDSEDFMSQEYNNSYSWTSDKHSYFWDSKMNGYSIDQKVTKTIYDPCPIGWSIPQHDTFTGLSESNTKVADNGQYCTIKDGSQNLFIPFAGYLHYEGFGSVRYVGIYSCCWLSAPERDDCGHLLVLFRHGVNPQNDSNRSEGCSVRPLLIE